MLRRSHTYVMELNTRWEGAFSSEPYEAAWASEGILFVRTLASENFQGGEARVEISPDGLNWCEEGTSIALAAAPSMTFCRLSHFGGWLRLSGTLPDGAWIKVIVYAALKE